MKFAPDLLDGRAPHPGVKMRDKTAIGVYRNVIGNYAVLIPPMSPTPPNKLKYKKGNGQGLHNPPPASRWPQKSKRPIPILVVAEVYVVKSPRAQSPMASVYNPHQTKKSDLVEPKCEWDKIDEPECKD